MYIKVNDVRVDIESQTVNRYDSRRGLVLTITTTREHISLGELDSLCTDIMTNKSDIYVYNDNDELVTVLHGFSHNCFVSSDSDTGKLKAEITNESENTFQIGLLQGRSINLEEASERHASQIEECAEVIMAQSEIIAIQEEQVGDLIEQNAMSVEAIETMLLDVIPITVQSTIEEVLSGMFPSVEDSEGVVEVDNIVEE